MVDPQGHLGSSHLSGRAAGVVLCNRGGDDKIHGRRDCRSARRLSEQPLGRRPHAASGLGGVKWGILPLRESPVLFHLTAKHHLLQLLDVRMWICVSFSAISRFARCRASPLNVLTRSKSLLHTHTNYRDRYRERERWMYS